MSQGSAYGVAQVLRSSYLNQLDVHFLVHQPERAYNLSSADLNPCHQKYLYRGFLMRSEQITETATRTSSIAS